MIGACNPSGFLNLLNGRPSGAVLFEPYIPQKLAERLIWRAGGTLWDSPEHRLDTLSDVYAYLGAGTVTVDAVGTDAGALCEMLEKRGDGCIYTVIADSVPDLRRFDACRSVLALASHRPLDGDFDKPLILLADENSDPVRARDEADGCGMKGVYLSGRIPVDAVLEKSCEGPVILGGLGAAFLNSSGPLTIYARVRELLQRSAGHWAIGSGNAGGEIEYLSFISMLGIYNKIKNEEY